MGTSIQQIVVGVICLGAAFAFGSYINQNPSLGDPNELNDVALAPTIDLDLAAKQLEKIPALKHRVTSLNSIDPRPESTSNSEIEISESPKLPSPGDLDPRLNLSKPSRPEIATRLNDGSMSAAPSPNTDEREIAMPDFSGLDVAGVSTRSPETAAPNSTSQLPQTKQTKPMSTIENPHVSAIKNIADSFRSKPDQPLAPPDFRPNTPVDQFPRSQKNAAEPETIPNNQIQSNNPFNDVKPSIASETNGLREESTNTQVTASDVRSGGMAPMNSINQTSRMEPMNRGNASNNKVVSKAGEMSSVLDPEKGWGTDSTGQAFENRAIAQAPPVSPQVATSELEPGAGSGNLRERNAPLPTGRRSSLKTQTPGSE